MLSYGASMEENIEQFFNSFPSTTPLRYAYESLCINNLDDFSELEDMEYICNLGF